MCIQFNILDPILICVPYIWGSYQLWLLSLGPVGPWGGEGTIYKNVYTIQHSWSYSDLCAKHLGELSTLIVVFEGTISKNVYTIQHSWSYPDFCVKKSPIVCLGTQTVGLQHLSRAQTVRGPAVWGPTVRGPAVLGPTVRRPAVWGPSVRGPAHWGPIVRGPKCPAPSCLEPNSPGPSWLSGAKLSGGPTVRDPAVRGQLSGARLSGAQFAKSR